MHRLLEFLFGLERGFLSRDGEFHWHFNPQWPMQAQFGAAGWNLFLGGLGLFLVYYVYTREGHSKPARILLGVTRVLLLGLLLMILNRPIVTLEQSIKEPSILAILIDDTISMQVKDSAQSGNSAKSPTTVPSAIADSSRLSAVQALFAKGNGELIRELSKQHVVKLYRFTSTSSSGASEPIATIDIKESPKQTKEEREKLLADSIEKGLATISGIQATGNSTQVVSSVRSVMEGLAGQRVAGVVLLTDGRDTPSENLTEAMATIKRFGVKVFPVPVGSDQAPRNISMRTLSLQDSAFKGDIVNVKAQLQVTGFEPGHQVKLALIDAKKKVALRGMDGLPSELVVTVESDKPQNVELQFKADMIGMIDVMMRANSEPGEIDEADNQKTAAIEVLDARINVVYVDGYPRWEYRYIKTDMIREPTINLSCILQSAETGFTQEHSRIDNSLNLKHFPYSKFPETLDQLREADVVLFGDVDPARLSDSQMQLIRTFVEEYGGGFGMVAGTRWSPSAFKNTPIQDLLPVQIASAQPDLGTPLNMGFRPVVTKEGLEASIFRYFTDRKANDLYMKDRIPPIFWYSKGIVPKPGLAEVYAEHPTDVMADGRKAPLLVVGHFGAGRTLFSATDDAWRWRFYTGETIFHTYYVQQLRYLARSKKLGSRGMTFNTLRESYEVGEQVKLSLHVLNRKLLTQLPEQLGVEILDATGQLVRNENLVRQEGQNDTYIAQFQADRIGTFTARLPAVTPDSKPMNIRLDVVIPARELEQPQLDRGLLSRLASETNAMLPQETAPKLIELASAREDLPKIPSAARSIPLFSDMPLWNAPLAMALFVLLITFEWIFRKLFGMV